MSSVPIPGVQDPIPDITVLIADDHPIVCKGIRLLLQPADGITVIGEAHTGTETLRMIETLQPTVVLLDMELPELTGVEVVRHLAESGRSARIVGLSSYDDREFISQLLALGASGYLLKDEVPEQIVEAVRGAARGETGWVSRKVAARLTDILQKDKGGEAEFNS